MVKLLVGTVVFMAIKLAYLGSTFSVIFYLEEPVLPKSLIKS